MKNRKTEFKSNNNNNTAVKGGIVPNYNEVKSAAKQLTSKDLRKIVKSMGIAGYSKMSKDRLVRIVCDGIAKGFIPASDVKSKEVENREIKVSQPAPVIKESKVETEPEEVENEEVEDETTLADIFPEKGDLEDINEDEDDFSDDFQEDDDDEEITEEEGEQGFSSMVMLNNHVDTFRYKYLLAVLANQVGVQLNKNEDGTVSAIGEEEDLVELSDQFGEYTTFINRTRIATWRKAKKENKLVDNLEKSLILGMLHQIKGMQEFLVKNTEYQKTIKRNIKEEDIVSEWYQLGKQLVREYHEK